MNNYFILGIFTVCSFLGSAQYDGKGEDEISRFRPGLMRLYTGLRPGEPDKSNKYDRLIFDVTYNDWMGDRALFENHWASIGLNTNLLFDIPLTKGNKVSLGIGVAHQYVNIRHNNHLLGDEIDKKTIWVEKDSLDVFKKSVFSGNSFSIPIEFRFRNESWRHFKFHIGGKIGYQANAFSKYVSSINGDKEVYKHYGFPDLNQLIYSVHARVGVRNWALFASYNLNSLFSNNESVQLNLVQMGVSISLF